MKPKSRKPSKTFNLLKFRSYLARPREAEALDENVRYTFDDEDEKENDDEGVNRHAVLSREVDVSGGSYNQA